MLGSIYFFWIFSSYALSPSSSSPYGFCPAIYFLIGGTPLVEKLNILWEVPKTELIGFFTSDLAYVVYGTGSFLAKILLLPPNILEPFPLLVNIPIPLLNRLDPKRLEVPKIFLMSFGG